MTRKSSNLMLDKYPYVTEGDVMQALEHSGRKVYASTESDCTYFINVHLKIYYQIRQLRLSGAWPQKKLKAIKNSIDTLVGQFRLLKDDDFLSDGVHSALRVGATQYIERANLQNRFNIERPMELNIGTSTPMRWMKELDVEQNYPKMIWQFLMFRDIVQHTIEISGGYEKKQEKGGEKYELLSGLYGGWVKIWQEYVEQTEKGGIQYFIKIPKSFVVFASKLGKFLAGKVDKDLKKYDPKIKNILFNIGKDSIEYELKKTLHYYNS